MKTIIVYEMVPEKTQFFMVDGDRSELNGCFINTKDGERFSEAVQAEVSEAKWGKELLPPFELSGPAKIVHCGFFL